MASVRLDKIRPAGAGVNYLFISLYLILLAFFILLTSISTVEEQQTNAAFGSVVETFRQETATPHLEQQTHEQQALFRARSDFFSTVQSIFSETLALGEFDAREEGNVLELQLASDALFKDGVPELSSVTGEFMGRVARVLSTPVNGLDYQMQFIGGVVGEDSSADSPSLMVLRSGVFARTLRERGAPAKAIRVGGRVVAAPPKADHITLRFLVRDDTG